MTHSPEKMLQGRSHLGVGWEFTQTKYQLTKLIL